MNGTTLQTRCGLVYCDGWREGEAWAINRFITQHCATRCQAVAQSGCRLLLGVLMAAHMRRHRRRHPSTAFILASATNAQNSSQSLTCNWVWVSAPPAAHQWDQSFVLWSCSSSLPLPSPSSRPFSLAPPTKPLLPPSPEPTFSSSSPQHARTEQAPFALGCSQTP